MRPGRAGVLALTVALLAGSAGCSYLKWRKERLHGHHGPAPAGDGTITLASPLDPRAQAVATGMSGYEQTHVGILSDRAALEELARVLDETSASGAGK